MPRKPWADRSRGADARITGRKGVALRAARLEAEPLCRHCAAKGRTTASIVPDHIIPLAVGGVEDGQVVSPNIQCLCHECHEIKTAAEGALTGGAANHPLWLEPSAIPLTIVSGPPCSGKTTYVAANAGPHDEIICLDTILSDLHPGYSHWTTGLNSGLFNRAIRVRNAKLGALARASKGRAWFIISAPTKAEREWWRSKLGGELLLLHPGADECKRRADARGTPRAKAGIDAWERASRSPWAEPKAKAVRVATGLDGWPVE